MGQTVALESGRQTTHGRYDRKGRRAVQRRTDGRISDQNRASLLPPMPPPAVNRFADKVRIDVSSTLR